jgi:hypothetical protein
MPTVTGKQSMKTVRDTSWIDEQAVHPDDAGPSTASFHRIVGRSPALQRVLRLVETIATTKETVPDSIDFLCIPRFDSPAVFAGILDDEKGGHFRIAPAGGGSTVRTCSRSCGPRSGSRMGCR